ncbi:MAG: ATP-binding protein [Bacteroidota bacterium]|nr:ATP-binding protein [Bacteroidota bacterium]
MIENLKVDGFKSLRNFEIKFQKGINVIVGPNGVGKTNICQALTILSSLTNNSLNDAFTQFGGVRSTFNLVDCEQENKKITVEASGRTIGTFKNQEYDLEFKYSIELGLSEELLVNSEVLEVKRKSKQGTYKKVLSIKQDKKTLVAKILDNELIGDFSVIKKGEKQFKLELNESEYESKSFLPLISRFIFVCHLVAREFSKIKSLNIDPHIARQACDITEPKEMLGNGKYLANTLHLLSKKPDDLIEINSILEQLLPNFKEIKPEISEISLKRFFSLIDKRRHGFSSNSLSDGTIKLLALLVGIVRQKEKTTIIEEPENYLHPYANRLLINYLRDTFDNGVCILTSHSETILNLIQPEELIICELDGSFTTCKRLDNIESIKRVIESSGFGCGYHYIAGNLGGTPQF